MKGVIVAAGYGTRFLPLTKTLPKEMLPLYDKPIIDFILDEFEEAGIKDVIIITSRRKKMLDDYLDREIELETILKRDGKDAQLKSIQPRNMNFIFIRQQEMKGTGQALLLTKSIIGNEAFVVAYPDDIVLSETGTTKKLVDLYNKTGKNIMAVRKEEENLSRFGVIKSSMENGILHVECMVEKPKKNEAPSNLVSIGRYLFTPEILSILEEGYKKHTGGEYYHISAINALAARKEVLAYEIDGTMLDTGEPYSYINSLLLYLKNHKEASKILQDFVKKYYK
jgi:UTP--glucose-1-phosphate uridylyltransferase